MSYCYDFIKKFRKVGNFCGLDKSEVSRLEAYIEIIEMLMKQHRDLDEKKIVNNFPLGAARYLIPIKDERRADGLDFVAHQITAGKHISGKAMQKKLEISNKEPESTVQTSKEPEKRDIGKSLTQPPRGPPNHGQFVAQPGTLPVTDAPPQPSLAEQQAAKDPAPATAEEVPEASAEQPIETAVSVPKPIPPCHRGEPCPEITLEKLRGKVCKRLGVPCNQLPKSGCPLDRTLPAGFQRATGAPSIASGLPKAQVSTNARRLVIDFNERQWRVLELLQDDGRAETFIEAILFLVDEVGRERGLIP